MITYVAIRYLDIPSEIDFLFFSFLFFCTTLPEFGQGLTLLHLYITKVHLPLRPPLGYHSAKNPTNRMIFFHLIS